MTAERCCASMTDALAWHMLDVLDGEVVLAARPLTEVNPQATAGNVLTGETYPVVVLGDAGRRLLPVVWLPAR